MLKLITRLLIALLALLALFAPGGTAAQNSTSAGSQSPPYGVELPGFQYPYPVAEVDFSSQRQTMHMAYMDVRPAKPKGHAAVLLHGKNFWQRRRAP
jgi:hypothetical protein